MCMYGSKNQLMVFKHFWVGRLFYNGVESGLRDSPMMEPNWENVE